MSIWCETTSFIGICWLITYPGQNVNINVTREIWWNYFDSLGCISFNSDSPACEIALVAPNPLTKVIINQVVALHIFLFTRLKNELFTSAKTWCVHGMRNECVSFICIQMSWAVLLCTPSHMQSHFNVVNFRWFFLMVDSVRHLQKTKLYSALGAQFIHKRNSEWLYSLMSFCFIFNRLSHLGVFVNK